MKVTDRTVMRDTSTTSFVCQFGAVAIGRNEGERLKICLDSLMKASALVYVDSGSSDDSVQMARARGVDVVNLDLSIPFTAARARNAGFARLLEIVPHLRYVQFVDGDCELASRWPSNAVSFLESRPDVAAVCGRLRERHPQQSIYTWLCEKEWDRPIGETPACAGNVMMRADALVAVGGYREDVIAAEEDELCVRLRAANWRIWRLGSDMALHDAALVRFSQWWRRSMRAGYAFAQGAHLHGKAPERHFVWESRRCLLWGILLPSSIVLISLALGERALLLWLAYPLQVLRLTFRGSGPIKERAILAFFQVLARFPEGVGQMKFFRDLLFRRDAQIIEHK